ncbi:MAG: methionyl-tRNA formyltransferase [Luminiphilus sp.]|nr:methionyl-tRNA formyltransferase [Luminiphilus sp.]MDG1460063.1 methionyl-tRNA formyltransferase [Luminiphilus sp.]
MSNARRVIFAGTPEFAATHLNALIVAGHDVCAVLTQPDRRAGRGKQLQPSAVKRRAQSAGITVLQPESLRTPESHDLLTALNAEIMIVVAYGLILPQTILDIPVYGCLNVHASLLPRWRGAAPIQRAIEAGDAQTGVTIMKMEAGLDTGPMITKGTLDITTSETSGTLHDRLAGLGPELLLEVLENFPHQLAQATPQKDHEATYAAKINKDETQLDWELDALTLSRKVRAFNPASICFSYLSNERIKIWQAIALSEPHNSSSGRIIRSDAEGIVVACGDGALKITVAQFPGAKALPVSELLNGRNNQLAVDQRFTSHGNGT